jgi:hypothetical protein
VVDRRMLGTGGRSVTRYVCLKCGRKKRAETTPECRDHGFMIPERPQRPEGSKKQKKQKK